MAVRFVQSVTGNRQPRQPSDFSFAVGGGVLAGGQTMQLLWNDNNDEDGFPNTMAGKEKLINALIMITQRLESAKDWPPLSGD